MIVLFVLRSAGTVSIVTSHAPAVVAGRHRHRATPDSTWHRIRPRRDAPWQPNPAARPHPTVPYLWAAEVADILHVSPKTVSRWATEGKLPFLKTLGGHRRYPAAEIRQLAAELQVRPTA
jgi:excisionase family DNA binding protein